MEQSDDEMLNIVKSNMDSWFLMSSIYVIIGISIMYIVMATKIGPSLVKNKKPMDLTNTIIVYNGVLVVCCSYWLYKLFSQEKARRYLWDAAFNPQLFKVDVELEKQLDELVYYYVMSKFVEFMDTVFFILRQKWNQLSVLHIYHHTNISILSWVFVKYIWARHAVVIGSINVFVHVVMYSYYLLAAMGPAVRPYLWWKKYITKLQLAQFALCLVYVLLLCFNKCHVQNMFLYITAANTTSFFFLFFNFYLNTYKKPSAKNK